jgi:hypothetical protein
MIYGYEVNKKKIKWMQETHRTTLAGCLERAML